MPVKNSTVCFDRPFNDLVAILEIDDDNLRLRIFARLLPNADEIIRLKGLARGQSHLLVIQFSVLTQELNPIEDC